MDCDRFEATLIDELYEELDELTSAAAKRHIAGCSRCASLIGGLRATRRVAVLPLVEPSVDLEDRILAAARNAQKVVPIGRRLSRAVSWAGSWAMRPQTAMAAVFVLMVGSSLLFVRRGKVMAVDSSLTVTGQGEPGVAPQASAATSDEQLAFDSKQAAAAHGTGPPPAGPAAATPAATAAASPSASELEGALALKEGPKEKARAISGKADPFGGSPSLDGVSANAEAPAGAPVAHYAPPPMAKRARSQGYDDTVVPSDLDNRGQSSGGGAVAQNQAQPESRQASDPMAGARNLRDTSGCGVAAGAFDQVAKDAPPGSSTSHQATYEAANCYRALGQSEEALKRYRSLIGVKELESQATASIAAIQNSQNQFASKATRKAAAPSKPSAIVATPPAQAPPQASPAAPPPPQNGTDQAPAKQQSAY